MTANIPGPNDHAAYEVRRHASRRRRVVGWAPTVVVLAAGFSFQPAAGQVGLDYEADRTARATPSFLPRSAFDTPDLRSIGQDGGWRFELTPYLWAAGMDGQVGAGDRAVDVQVSFEEILENLDGAVMLAGSAMRGRWAGAFEILYIRLSAQRATPGPLFTDAELDAKQVMFELTGRYRLLSTEPADLDLFAGGRYWNLDNTIRLTEGILPEVEVPVADSWIDPIVGARVTANLGSRWLLNVRGDVGGFDSGSDSTAQILAVFAYRPTTGWTIDAGYRYLFVHFSNELIFDVAMSGVVVGVTAVF